ncbi:MAG TPA: VWA domain-containing protein [Candidatus Nanoarchaeia archaeon]|nr:VWA domain-containing protein [Candidatus Nanoarchaeia archaeon]
MAILPDSTLTDSDKDILDQGTIEELQGQMSSNPDEEENKLAHSVMEADEETIKEGELVNDAMNNGINSFIPDLMFEQMVNDFKTAKNIYGETIIRHSTGYAPEYVERNIKVPEFRRELKERIKDNLDEFKDKGILARDYSITQKGMRVASLVMYMQELDHIIPRGIFGETIHKKRAHYGDHEDVKPFKKGDRYRDIALKQTIKTAIRRGHSTLEKEDLKSFDRQSKGQVEIIYGLDASGSMKGKKIEVAKKAGVALAFKAIQNKDNVGLIVFGEEVKHSITPCQDFHKILEHITEVKPSKETDLVSAIKESIEMFSSGNVTKHLILLTDALHTIGTTNEVIDISSLAKASGVTISIIGIKLDAEGAGLAQQITALSNGKLYVVTALDNVDTIVLEDYYSIR